MSCFMLCCSHRYAGSQRQIGREGGGRPPAMYQQQAPEICSAIFSPLPLAHRAAEYSIVAREGHRLQPQRETLVLLVYLIRGQAADRCLRYDCTEGGVDAFSAIPVKQKSACLIRAGCHCSSIECYSSQNAARFSLPSCRRRCTSSSVLS